MPMIVLGIALMLPLMLMIFSMSREYAGQVAHVDEIIRCRSIAMSVFSKVQAKIREKPYSQRFFAGSAFREYISDFHGGEYELFVVDTPNKPMQADIYVIATYRRVRKLFFWRILIEATILDAVGKIIQILHANLDPMQFGNGSPASSANDYINGILDERRANRKKAAEKAAIIKPQASLTDIAAVLEIPDPDQIENSTDPAAASMNDVPAVPPPPGLPITVVVFNEDFENLPGDQIPGEWAVHGAGTADISSEVAAAGQKSLKIYVPQSSQTMKYKVDFQVDGEPDRIIIQMDIFVKDATSGAGFSWFPISSNAVLMHGKNGTAYFVKASEQVEQIQNFQVGRWYNTKMEIDRKNGKTSIYLDGQSAYSISFANMQIPNHLYFGSADYVVGGNNQTVCFDNIQVLAEYAE